MNRFPEITPLARRLQKRGRDESGSVMVEFALVLPLFLLLLFGLIDFGRLGYEYVMAAKATDLATRTAVARPPACPGVPEANARGSVTGLVVPPRFGTACGSGANVCAAPVTVTCTGTSTNATASEIWARVDGLMPSNATVANLRFSYAYDPNLGFLGGPYVPVVTVEITELEFQYVSPLGALATFAGGDWDGFRSSITFPSMSTSLPAEDLALGNSG
jgi:hypothetical protein